MVDSQTPPSDEPEAKHTLLCWLTRNRQLEALIAKVEKLEASLNAQTNWLILVAAILVLKIIGDWGSAIVGWLNSHTHN